MISLVDRRGLGLLVTACSLAWLALHLVTRLPERVLVSTHDASAGVVLVGTSPREIEPRAGRHGVSMGPVGGSASSGRVRLDDGTEFFVMFPDERPEVGALIDVTVRTFDDGSRHVSLDRGF